MCINTCFIKDFAQYEYGKPVVEIHPIQLNQSELINTSVLFSKLNNPYRYFYFGALTLLLPLSHSAVQSSTMVLSLNGKEVLNLSAVALDQLFSLGNDPVDGTVTKVSLTAAQSYVPTGYMETLRFENIAFDSITLGNSNTIRHFTGYKILM